MDFRIEQLIYDINKKIQAAANTELKKYGLTIPQSRALSVLMNRNGYRTSSEEMEKSLCIPHNTLITLTNKMEREGLVNIYTENEFRYIALTDKAVKIGNALNKAMRQHEKKLLSPLAKTDQSRLENMLDVIFNNMG